MSQWTKALAVTGAFLLSACIRTDWHPESARELEPLVQHALRVYEADLPVLKEAGARKIGSVEASSTSVVVDFDALADKAASDGAERGGTHVFLASSDLRWSTVQTGPGTAQTTCQEQGYGRTNCSTVYTPPSQITQARRSAWIVVIRVERENWGDLPSHLRPAKGKS